MQLKTIFSLLAAAASTHATPISPLDSRAVVSHTSLYPLAESLPSGVVGESIRKYEPYLHIAHGCFVMTAVGNNGDTNGGLAPSGNPEGNCRYTDRKQTYVRTATYNGRFAIMYAWYWPKDQPVNPNIGGHRHEWESVVVWLNSAGGSLIGAAASGHGGYTPSTSPQISGSQVKVEYFTNFPTNHELQFTATQGETGFAKVHWDNLSSAARTALQNTNFGDANVPFKDGNFESNLAKAVV